MSLSLKLTKGYVALIDDEDKERISNHSWCALVSTHQIRAVSRIKGKFVYLHRFILNVKDKDIVVDHINGDSLDNRKCNLRICSQSDNIKNMKLKNSNTSGFKGVSFIKKENCWRARIVVNRKEIYLGRFSSKVLAAAAYNKAAIQYYGEFARLNKIGVEDETALDTTRTE